MRKAAFLLVFSALALDWGAVYAHDGRASAQTGLSEAARLANASPSGVGQIASLSGWFHIIFGDAPSGSGVPAIFGYVLIDDQGQATELLVDEQALQARGGVRTINHQRVTVTGQAAAAPLSRVRPALPLFAVQALQPDGPERMAAAVAAEQAISGSQRWATILCRFQDSPGVTPNPVSYFQNLILGTTPPGLDHYWREVSNNNVNLVGSAVYGWYDLPQPRSYYVYGTPLQLDFQRAANDCTARANADVFFPDFVGINLMFNDDLDGFAWGGSWTLTLDGLTKTYRMTWIPPWGYENQGPIAHEMGHGFGLHHSSGPYSATYDSRWDVMSDIWDNCPPYDPTYGCVGPHTIAYHKDILGWIPSAQKYLAAPGTSQSIVMERLGQPTTSNYLMAQLPIGGAATQFYTVEVRRFAGYDTKLPGEGVVIHRVDTTLSDRNARVVDTDGNGNPNDASAMWLPGESFVDSVNQFTVAVNAQLATGFQVTITNGVSSSFTLSVTVTGTGTVTSNPPGINNCSSGTCVANFAAGASVTLTVISGKLSGWGGACSGTGPCTVSMTANRSVTATFDSSTLSVSPTTVAPGGSVTATWSGIATPTATDWIGLYTPAGPDTAFITWIYVSCSQTPGSAKAAGSCAFGIPGTVTPGPYQLRLFANNVYTKLATSNALTVGGGNTVPGTPTGLSQFRSDGVTGIAVGGATPETTVVLKGTVSDPDNGQTVKLQLEVRPLGTAFTNTATHESALLASGSLASVAAGGLAPGTSYHWQGRAVDSVGGASAWVAFGGNAETTADFAVSATGPSLGVSPTTVAPGGSVTATWSGIATPTSTDWIGLYAPGAANSPSITWIYVSCSQTPGSAAAAGACAFGIPATVAAGTYELRLFANNGYTRLATSNALTVN